MMLLKLMYRARAIFFLTHKFTRLSLHSLRLVGLVRIVRIVSLCSSLILGAAQHLNNNNTLYAADPPPAAANATKATKNTAPPPQKIVHPTVFYDFTFAVLKYSGGGDWYEGQVGVKELMKFVNTHQILVAEGKPAIVEISSFDLFEYPLLYVTGHGGWVLSSTEARRLREYLENGGLLFINDDYGLDPFVRAAVKKIFPERNWTPLPLTHEIYSIYYNFPKGVPKIHKHDGGPPQIFAIFHDGEMAILYTKNTDIGDGWAPYNVHKNSQAARTSALRFGMNIILYALNK